jgi:hypothetical protein
MRGLPKTVTFLPSPKAKKKRKRAIPSGMAFLFLEKVSFTGNFLGTASFERWGRKKKVQKIQFQSDLEQFLILCLPDIGKRNGIPVNRSLFGSFPLLLLGRCVKLGG